MLVASSVEPSFSESPTGGTGSRPPGCQGWQRATRRNVSQPPRHKPWARNASAPYVEHVGWKRQVDGSNGDTKRR